MNFTEAVKSAFQNYANFSGRAQRSAFWYWVLFEVIASFVVILLDLAIFGQETWFPLTWLFYLATLIPYLSVGVRRLHDIGRTGWWWLIYLIPLVGIILLIVWWCQRGEPGTNKYGPNPLGE